MILREGQGQKRLSTGVNSTMAKHRHPMELRPAALVFAG
jgi:hypothetical protein